MFLMRRKRFFKVLLFIFLLIPLTSVASVSDLRDELSSITSKLSPEFSIKVVSLNSRQNLFRENADKLLNPASTTKIITAAAALAYLGPNFRFKTYFYINKDNDLFVKGEGDPSLVIEDLKIIAQQLAQKGIKYIRNIIVDDSYFANYTSPGLKGKGHYDFYTGALSLNFNRLTVNVTPSRRRGALAKVVAGAGEGVKINVINKVESISRRGYRLSINPPIDEKDDYFIVYGQVPAGGKTRSRWYNVSLPPLYVVSALESVLKNSGCYIAGKFYIGHVPTGARLVLTHESKDLSEILADMNKFSNNFIAEQIVKVLGAKFAGIPGTTAKGVAVIEKYLVSIGMQPNSYVLVNGSGLTYENRVSASQLVRVIQNMYNSPKLWNSFEGSLAIAGVDGTMRRRHRKTILYNKLRAKTGTLNRVRAIAGIIPKKNNEVIGYAILLNGSSAANARKIQGEVALAIGKY